MTYQGKWAKVSLSDTSDTHTSTFEQTWDIRSIMHSDYVKQPVASPNSQSFAICPGCSGTKSVSADTFSVRYPFADSLASDSLSNSPPVITPDPFTGFDASSMQLTTSTLGTVVDGITYLANPVGDLTLSNVGTLKAGQTITFACADWILSKMSSSENH